MFEAAELGRKVSKQEFEEAEGELRTQLLAAQRELRESKRSVVVVVSGVEGSRKSEVVNRLCEWLDPRGVQTHAFWDDSNEERERPRFWRFWRRLPPRGAIGIMFGSWYTQPIIDHAFERLDEAAFEQEMRRCDQLEQTLAVDGAIFVKFWFHLSKTAQVERLSAIKAADGSSLEGKGKGKEKKKGKGKKKDKDKKKEKRKKDKKKGKGKKGWKLSPHLEEFSPLYDTFARVSEAAIRLTDTAHGPWHIVEAADRNYRDLTAGRVLLAAIQHGLSQQPAPPAEARAQPVQPEGTTILDSVDLTQSLELADYKVQLAEAQARINRLAWGLRNQRRSCVAVFEGWDASGKGGAIRRCVAPIDARLYRVIPFAAPSDEERAQHYLWRFWRQVPEPGCLRVFDRSWYGRVLVERVEGFAREDEWLRAFHEINAFESQLIEHGIGVAKFWIHISQDEQLRRFEERSRVPWKQHKITDEDWRNREQWEAYTEAIDDMVKRTSTLAAPWTLVSGNDKRFARVKILETLADRIEATLAR